MSIRSKFWAIKHGISFSAAGQLDDAMRDTSSRRIKFNKDEALITVKRMNEEQPIRGNVSHYGMLYAISKESMSLIHSPLLKVVLQIILDFNKTMEGKHVSANAQARTDNRFKQ